MYIVFEGIVGSGKTTQVKKLVEYFRQTPFVKGGRGDLFLKQNPQSAAADSSSPRRNFDFTKELHKVLHIREPGSTPIAEDIRYLAQAKVWDNDTMHPLTNAYLYAAARTQTLHTLVKPALERWDIVISDRSFLSSCAIQGEAQWLGIEAVLRINEEAIHGVLPDVVFYLDVDIDLALSRTSDAIGDKFEREWKKFYESIIRGYEKCEKLEIIQWRFIRIDASGEKDAVFARIISAITF